MASASGSDDIRVLSWNINGLKTKLKKHRKAVLNIFDQYDVVLLQETKIGPMKDGKNDERDWTFITKALSKKYVEDVVKLEVEEEEEVEEVEEEEEEEEEEEGEEEEEEEEGEGRRRRDKVAGKMYMTYFRSNSEGVAILINKPHTLLKGSCVGGKYAWVHVEIDDQKYTFVSVYHHRKYRNLICNLRKKIEHTLNDGSGAFKHRPVIGGDFNTTLDPERDTNRANPDHDARRETLKEFMSILKLSDVWREKHEHDPEPTYTYVHKMRPKNEPEGEPTKSRLDYVFMLEKDVKYVRSCDIRSEITLSDHSPVSLTLNYPQQY